VIDPGSIDELADLSSIEVSERELAMAEQLVESLAGPFEPERYKDAYREQVLDLISRKADGEELRPVEVTTTAPPVVDLMAALEASVKAAKEARGRHPTAAPEPADAGTEGAAQDTVVPTRAEDRVQKSA
jgi:DNA end-binding protein Ku